MNEAALRCWRAHGCLLTAGLGLNTGETSPTYTATALHTWEGWGWGMEPPTSLGTDHAASTVWGARGPNGVTWWSEGSSAGQHPG